MSSKAIVKITDKDIQAAEDILNLELEKFSLQRPLKFNQVQELIGQMHNIYIELKPRQQHFYRQILSDKLDPIKLAEHFANCDKLTKQERSSLPSFLTQCQTLGLSIGKPLLEKTIGVIKNFEHDWAPAQLASSLRVLQKEKISYKTLGIAVAEYLESHLKPDTKTSIEDLITFSQFLNASKHFGFNALQMIAKQASAQMKSVSTPEAIRPFVQLHFQFAQAHFKDSNFTEQLANILKLEGSALPILTLSNALWSFAIINSRDSDLYETLKNKITNCLPSLSEATRTRVVNHTTWCLSIHAEQCAKDFFLANQDPLQAPTNDMQLHQALVALKLRQSNFPVTFTHQELESQVSKVNGFEEDVYNSLQRIYKIKKTTKHTNAQGKIKRNHTVDGIVVDFEVEDFASKSKLIIECDGVAYHYINRQLSEGLVGNDILQNKIFNRRGYCVVHINSQEWLEIPASDSRRKDSLVKARIQESIKSKPKLLK